MTPTARKVFRPLGIIVATLVGIAIWEQVARSLWGGR